jgi:hypothetical protein
MRVYFDEERRPIAVDTTHPIDLLEPDCEPTHHIGCDLLTLTEKVADSYLTGDPAVTRIAWRVLLRKEPESIRACARRAGCTAAAISKRVRILAKQCGLPLNDEKLRELRRQLATRAWQKRKRREATRPPAAADEQLEENSPHSKK